MSKKTIQSKIMKLLVVIILIITFFMVVVNLTIINQTKESIIYERLENASILKGSKDRNESTSLDDEETLLVTHYLILGDLNSYELYVDTFTQEAYEDREILIELTDYILENEAVSGRVSIEDDYYYYLLGDSKGNTMVFFTAVDIGREGTRLIISISLLLIIFSYFISKRVAKEIVKPIHELEGYADEISKRNWAVQQPKTDISEIHQLASSLELMKVKLKDAEDKDRQFLQNTSHDLKTPVMIIKGYAQAILDHKDMNSAQVILDETEKIDRRIKQLLQYNTLDHTLENNVFESFQLDRLINRLVKKFETISELEFITDINPFETKGNSESLLIAIENILDNQIRYAKNVVRITLDDTLIIENDGEAFHTEDPNCLFDAYKKDQTGNFGLGLSIVKKVIEAHHGNIEAKNIENGVQFKITLQKTAK